MNCQGDMKCQVDSFLTEFTTKIIQCMEDEFLVSIAPGIMKKVTGIGVVLEDTILFPEGGGQPCDQGVLEIVKEGIQIVLQVHHVIKQSGKVIHLVEECWDFPLLELPPGTPVHQSLFWPRRQYHMIQHSGQHLISALAENMFQLETLSWCLGPECCFIELEKITEAQYNILETEANRLIRKDLRVTAHVYQEGDPELEKAKTRGLPEDHVGGVRVVEIEGVDKNMCCGTHVSSLGQLEILKLLWTKDKLFKKKKTCLLYFVVGMERVFQRFDDMQQREFLISACLNKPAVEHASTIQDMMDSLMYSKKAVNDLQMEVAMLKINAFKEKEADSTLFSMHRPDGDMELMNFVARQFKNMNIVLFLTVGGEEGGHVLFEGPKELVSSLAPKISSLLVGKGKVSGNRFQAKVVHLGARKRAEDVIREGISTCSRSA